jgi:hypothetical protein
MKKFYLVVLFFSVQVTHAQLNTTIVGEDTTCISSEEKYSVEVSTYENNYLFRDTSQGTSAHFSLDAGYDLKAITNTFTYDLWVKPTRSITMVGESSICAGEASSVPMANSDQNWAIVPSGLANPNVSVGLSIGTNGLMVGEHSGFLLVSRLSYTTSINDWVHVGITYRTDSIFLYLDGELVRKKETHCPSDPKCLARGITGNYYSPNFKGNIDEFRVWDIALDKKQINAVKDKKLLNQADGLRYYASFDNGRFERTLGDIGQPTMKNNGLDAGGNRKKSNWQLDYYNGMDITNLTGFDVGEVDYLWSNGAKSHATYYAASDTLDTLSVTVSNSEFSQTDSLLIVGQNCCVDYITDTVTVYDTIDRDGKGLPDDNLVSYYPFQNNAHDLGSSGNDATVHGARLTTDRNGVENSAYYFDGKDDYLLIPDSLAITSNFTISFWAKSEKANGTSNIITDGSTNLGGNDFLINFRGDEIGIRADKSGKSLNLEYSSPSGLTGLDILNKWVHVTWTMNPDHSKIYLNGEEKAHINTPGTNLGYHDGESYIGARKVWTDPDNFFQGSLDEIRIYDRELSGDEVQTLYSGQGDSQVYHDTVTTQVYDTTVVTVRDSIAVTDTLVIDAVITDISSPGKTNTIKVYPNPAKDHLFINTGDYSLMNGYQIKIFNQTGTTVFDTYVDNSLYEIDLSGWTGKGLYFIQLINSNGEIIDIRKIILQ